MNDTALNTVAGSCPRCGSHRVSQTSRTRWVCAACGKQFTAKQ
jgi:transposase-like protein